MEFKNELGEVYNKTHFQENNKYVYLQWFGTYISVDEIAQVGIWELNECEKRGITRIINDNRELHGSWDHSNDWNATVWLPRALSLGINKLAHIISENIFEKMSAEEMQVIFADKITVRTFKDFDSAEDWILNTAD